MRIQSILLWINILVGAFKHPVKNGVNNRCFILSDIRKDVITIPELSTIIVPSAEQTKEWRKNTEWYSTGKFNECEKYQIQMLKQILYPNVLEKTNDRIHMEMAKIVSQRFPLKCADGFEYTENFDGVIQKELNRFYFNLKFVCDTGGAQTRTLREVYHFIRFQLETLLSKKNEIRQLSVDRKNIYFINILDGDTCYKSTKNFDYLIQKEKYREVLQNVFVGDLFTFQNSDLAKKIKDLGPSLPPP